MTQLNPSHPSGYPEAGEEVEIEEGKISDCHGAPVGSRYGYPESKLFHEFYCTKCKKYCDPIELSAFQKKNQQSERWDNELNKTFKRWSVPVNQRHFIIGFLSRIVEEARAQERKRAIEEFSQIVLERLYAQGQHAPKSMPGEIIDEVLEEMIGETHAK